jgi:hypothetical protein
MMSDANAPGDWSAAGDVLRAILERDRGVLDDAELLRNHLLDRIPERKAEINLLVSAGREGIPARITSAPAGVSSDALVTELASRLAAEQGLTHDRAEWAVRAWIHGLGRVPGSGALPGPRPPSPRRISPAVVAGVALLVVILVGVLAFRWFGGTDYTLDRMAFFYTDRPLADDAGELVNYNAWCEAGAELRTTGPPPYQCPIVLPFAPSTPRIKVELRVSLRGARDGAEMPFRCQLADDGGRVVATASSAGALASLTPGPADRAVWFTAFDRPGEGWAAGRYRATCETDEQSIQAWLDIK